MPTISSPFPLRVNKPIPRYITLPISEIALRHDSLVGLYSRGFYFVADMLLDPTYLPMGCQLELNGYLFGFNWAFGDLPSHQHLIKRLLYNDISPQLANAIKLRLHQLTKNFGDIRDLGRPSFLALALLPDLPSEIMTSELWDEFQDLLALRELRPKMTFEEIFSHHQPFALAPGEASALAVHRSSHPPMPIEAQLAAERARGFEVSDLLEQTARGHDRFPKAHVPLNEEQVYFLTMQVDSVAHLNAESVKWVKRLNYRFPHMIDALCSLLAVRPEERPRELVDWFVNKGIPIEPLSFSDLEKISEEARG
ncbi:TPA: hypothetical protein DEP96_02805 [Candidatus Uhrbacteria bacterium]|nr:hypothetical protein [Candidatus Uhrbacteria bacterium]